MKTLAVLSNGREFENQKLLRSELRKRKLAKLHRHIANQRWDYQHKMTTEIAQTYQIIGVEDLNVTGMLKNHRLALSIADAGFGEIQRQLRYKSAWYGGNLVEVDRFFPSSKTCRFCGRTNDGLSLSDRMWTCNCGAVLDRDRNAAINIEMAALRMIDAGVGSPSLKTRVEQVSDSSEQPAMKRKNRVEERRPFRLCPVGTVW